MLLSAMVGGAFAANQPATETDGGIAGARKDYEAISAARAGQTEQRRLTLPGAEVPTLDLGSDAPAIQRPRGQSGSETEKQQLAEKARKAENWLVDAVLEAENAEKSADLIDATPAESNVDAPPGSLLETALALEKEERTKEETAEKQKIEAMRTPVVNPLNAYMTSWLDPRDGAAAPSTLRLGDGSERGLGAVNPLERSNLVGDSARPDLHFADRGGFAKTDAPGLAMTAAPNPYLNEVPELRASLADQRRLAPGLPVFAPTRPVATAPAAIAIPDAAPTGTVAPPLSEVLKAQDDSRYFKQLKRF